MAGTARPFTASTPRAATPASPARWRCCPHRSRRKCLSHGAFALSPFTVAVPVACDTSTPHHDGASAVRILSPAPAPRPSQTAVLFRVGVRVLPGACGCPHRNEPRRSCASTTGIFSTSIFARWPRPSESYLGAVTSRSRFSFASDGQAPLEWRSPVGDDSATLAVRPRS